MLPGTRIKFKAPITTERSRTHGVSRAFLIFQQCITCMPEYENKSLEELRFEDYAANRKGSRSFTRPILREPVFQYRSAQSIGAPATGGLYSAGSLSFGQISQNTNLGGRATGATPLASTSIFGANTVVGTPGNSTRSQPQHKPNAAFNFCPKFGAPATLGESAFPSLAEMRTSLVEASVPTLSSTNPASGAAATSLGGSTPSSMASGDFLGAPNTTTAFGRGASTFGSTGIVTAPTFGTTGDTVGAPDTRGLLGTNTAAKPPGFGFGSTNTSTTFGGGFSTTSTRTIGSFAGARSRPTRGAAGTWGVPSTDRSSYPYFGFATAATANPLEPRSSAFSRHGTPEQSSTTEDICAICLGRCRDKAFVHGCFHAFCFACIVRWTRIKPICPVCNQRFPVIIYDVRSMRDYDQCSVWELGHPL